jgi:hypothetical protein
VRMERLELSRPKSQPPQGCVKTTKKHIKNNSLNQKARSQQQLNKQYKTFKINYLHPN